MIEPADGKGYERDPRSLAKRAEAYLKSTGLGDTAYFGPEPEFFIFDARALDASTCRAASARSTRKKRRGPPARSSRAATRATARPSRAATSRCRRSIRFQDIRSAMCLALEAAWASRSKCTTTKSPTAGQCEIGTKFATLVQRADWTADPEVRGPQRRARYGKTATFMPKPIVGDNGSGMHVHQSMWKDGKNLFAGDGYARPVGLRAVLHRRHHQARARR